MTAKRIKRKIDKILASSVLKVQKRPRFVISTFFLVFSLTLTQFVPSSQSFSAVLILSLESLILSLWCLWEELGGIEYFTLLSPPVLFTASVGFFYYLLPLRWITRVPVGLLYAVGMYAHFLTENIFNVAAIRTIALLRAARTVSLLFSLVTSFFLLNTIFSFHLAFYQNFLLVFILSFCVITPSYWNEKLTNNLDKNILISSLISSLLVAEISLILSFWPVKATFESLYLISVYYTVISIVDTKLREMPIGKTIWEYVILNILALFMLIRTAVWQI